MSDGPDGNEARAAAAATAGTATTAGAMLREARQAQGLHIAALAATIKVTQRKLEALEGDRYDELPDATFTRALAQAVCRALKIDAEPVLARLPATAGQGLDHVSAGLNTPLRHRTVRRDSGERFALNRPVVWATLVLLIAAAVVFLVPSNWWPLRLATVPAPAQAPSTSHTGGSVTTVVTPSPTVVGHGAAVPASAPGVAPAGTAASAAPSAVPAGAAASQAAVAAPVSPGTAAPASAAPGGALAIAAGDGPSWVSVRDANGRTLVARTVQAGEALMLDGPAPLHVILGDARVVRLTFRGQPVSLPPNQTVARLELK
jgi:cytoskeleton protein RodZ